MTTAKLLATQTKIKELSRTLDEFRNFDGAIGNKDELTSVIIKAQKNLLAAVGQLESAQQIMTMGRQWVPSSEGITDPLADQKINNK